MTSANEIFHLYRKRTPVSTVITKPVSSTSGRFRSQYEDCFRDKLILLIVSKVASVEQYRLHFGVTLTSIMMYFIISQERLLVSTTQNFALHARGRPSDTLPFPTI